MVHSKRSGTDHTVLPANNTMPAFPSSEFTRCHHHSNRDSGHPIAAHYSFIAVRGVCETNKSIHGSMSSPESNQLFAVPTPITLRKIS